MKTTRYIVKFGESVRVFYADYHAEQFCRALDLNHTPYTLHTVNLDAGESYYAEVA